MLLCAPLERDVVFIYFLLTFIYTGKISLRPRVSFTRETCCYFKRYVSLKHYILFTQQCIKIIRIGSISILRTHTHTHTHTCNINPVV